MDNPERITLGDKNELFVDDYLIDPVLSAGVCPGFTRLEFALNHPERGEVILTFDRPWEGMGSTYYSVLHDPASGLFMLYYRTSPATASRASTERGRSLLRSLSSSRASGSP